MTSHAEFRSELIIAARDCYARIWYYGHRQCGPLRAMDYHKRFTGSGLGLNHDESCADKKAYGETHDRWGLRFYVFYANEPISKTKVDGHYVFVDQ